MESFREFVNDSWQPFGRSTDVQVIGLNRVLFVGLLPTVALDSLHTTVYYSAQRPK
ncbi:MAG TPA: hypothetical protein VN641_00030 [Urbifossiella sp.]|nr:hypothetical protein [Urbifossiella sp.]